MQNYTLSQIAELLGAELQGDGALEIKKIATLANAHSGHIAFLANSKYRSQLETTQASAVIVSQADAEYFSGLIGLIGLIRGQIGWLIGLICLIGGLIGLIQGLVGVI